MKRFVAILMALTLLLGMSVTALAEDQTKTQTVSVSIPAFKYTLTIPVNTEIKYGTTGKQNIGKFSVSSTEWDTFKSNKMCVYVNVMPDLKLKNENGHTISYEWSTDTGDDEYKYFQGDGSQGYGIKVSDWSNAEPDTTYTTEITYAASVTAMPDMPE